MDITTERLTIRRIDVNDWKSIKELWDDQKTSVYSQFDKPNDTNPTAVYKRIEKWASYVDSIEHILFAVCLDEVLIGYVVFNRCDGIAYEIGYCFHSKYHGKGYAKESISTLINVIQSIQPNVSIIARTALENIPSVKLLQSIGFSQIGTERVSFYKDFDGHSIYFDGGIFELNYSGGAEQYVTA